MSDRASTPRNRPSTPRSRASTPRSSIGRGPRHGSVIDSIARAYREIDLAERSQTPRQSTQRPKGARRVSQSRRGKRDGRETPTSTNRPTESQQRRMQSYAKRLERKKETYERQKDQLGEEHPDTLQTEDRLATYYHLTAQHQKAIEHVEHVLEVRTKTLDKKHPDTLRSQEKLGYYYHIVGRYEDAIRLAFDAFLGRTLELVPEEPEALRLLEQLAYYYHLAAKNEKAIEITLRAYAGRKKTLGEDHPDTLRSTQQLAWYYHLSGQPEHAIRLTLQAAYLQKERLGDNHPLIFSLSKAVALYVRKLPEQLGSPEPDEHASKDLEASLELQEPSAKPTEYIDIFVDLIKKAISTSIKDLDAFYRVCDNLDSSIQTFAFKLCYSPIGQLKDIKLGYDAIAPLKNAAIFIYEHRGYIRQRLILDLERDLRKSLDFWLLRSAVLGLVSQSPIDEDTKAGGLSSDLSNFQIKEDSLYETDHLINDDPHNTIVDHPSSMVYRTLIEHSSAYNWLMHKLQRDAKLMRLEPHWMMESPSIFENLYIKHKALHLEAPRPYDVTVNVKNLDFEAFVKDQYFPNDPGSLMKVITLTGTPVNAQALTVEAYCRQVWPTTAIQVLQLVIGAMCTGEHSATLRDGTRIIAISGKYLEVGINGEIGTIMEVVQQLSWLGATLRSSPFQTGVAISKPLLRPRLGSGQWPSLEWKFELDFEVEREVVDAKSGCCWHDMFRNVVLVTGFPIAAKRPGLGIEMPLEMLPHFAGTDYVTTFNDATFIKGYSTMLTISNSFENLLVWHYQYSHNNERISYLDALDARLGATVQRLETCRHVVGWCNSCRCFTGDSEVNFDIESTPQDQRKPGWLLEKVVISSGMHIGVEASFSPGSRDISPRLTRDGYAGTLKWLNSQFVLLWDEVDARGWLVNGTSALLHLVRASLWTDSKGDFREACLFTPESLKLSQEDRYRASAAINVLLNEDNRALPIELDETKVYDEWEKDSQGWYEYVQKKRRTYRTFQDRVMRLASNLEQMIDHQRRVSGEKGARIKDFNRHLLEGWSFYDLVADAEAESHRVKMPRRAFGWVELLRSINAVTLFGSGFGELIKPEPSESMCSQWQSVPCGKHYLTIATTDLEKMRRKEGIKGPSSSDQFYRASSLDDILKRLGKKSRPILPQLVAGYLWHAPQDPLAPCQCQEGKTVERHHDPVQVIYPMNSRKMMPLKIPTTIEEGGAVIFGQSRLFPFRFGRGGKDDLESDREETVEADSDSSSISSNADATTLPENESSLSSLPSNTTEPASSSIPKEPADLDPEDSPNLSPDNDVPEASATSRRRRSFLRPSKLWRK